MTAEEIKDEMRTILDRLKFLGTIEESSEVRVSIYQLCGDYGGLQRELEEATA